MYTLTALTKALEFPIWMEFCDDFIWKQFETVVVRKLHGTDTQRSVSSKWMTTPTGHCTEKYLFRFCIHEETKKIKIKYLIELLVGQNENSNNLKFGLKTHRIWKWLFYLGRTQILLFNVVQRFDDIWDLPQGLNYWNLLSSVVLLNSYKPQSWVK